MIVQVRSVSIRKLRNLAVFRFIVNPEPVGASSRLNASDRSIVNLETLVFYYGLAGYPYL